MFRWTAYCQLIKGRIKGPHTSLEFFLYNYRFGNLIVSMVIGNCGFIKEFGIIISIIHDISSYSIHLIYLNNSIILNLKEHA